MSQIYQLINVTRGVMVTVQPGQTDTAYLQIGDVFQIQGSGWTPNGLVASQSYVNGSWQTGSGFLVASDGTFHSEETPVQSDVGLSQPTRVVQTALDGTILSISGTINLTDFLVGADYTFTIVDAVTFNPIPGAEVDLFEGAYQSGDGVRGYTDVNGRVGFSPGWVAKSYEVIASGYTTFDSIGSPTSNVQINLRASGTGTYLLSVGVAGSGAVSATVNGTPISLAAPYSVPAGATVSVTATPTASSVFLSWKLGATVLSTNNPYTFTMSGDITTLVADFQDLWMLSIVAASGGTTSPAPGPYYFQQGKQVAVTAIPDVNFSLDHWNLNNVNIGSTNPVTFTPTANDLPLEAVFVSGVQPVQYHVSITSTPVSGGYTNPAGGLTANQNSQLAVTATPNSGYVFDHWELNGTVSGGSNPTTTFTIDRDNYVIVAAFTTNPSGGACPYQYKFVNQWDSITSGKGVLSAGNPAIVEADQWNTDAGAASKSVSLGDASVFTGAQILYNISYMVGTDDAQVGISLNGVGLISQGVSFTGNGSGLPTSINGTLNLTPAQLAANGNVITVGQANTLASWNKVSYDVTLFLCYSAQPKTEPSASSNPFSNLQWWEWLIIAGVGIGGLYVVGKAVGGRSGGTTIQIIGAPIRRAASGVKKRITRRKG